MLEKIPGILAMLRKVNFLNGEPLIKQYAYLIFKLIESDLNFISIKNNNNNSTKEKVLLRGKGFEDLIS